MSGPTSEGSVRFATTRGADVELFETGVRYPTGTRRRWFKTGSRFTPYREMTHLWQSGRGLVIASTRGIEVLSAQALRDPAQMGALTAALRASIARVSRGDERLERMDALDRRVTQTSRPLLGRSLTAMVMLVAGLALWFPNLASELSFRAGLVESGEYWRLLTLHLVHTHPMHLLLNAAALWILGDLVELSLGRGLAWATTSLAALGAALGCIWMSYPEAQGASGVVAGFAGALLVLELRVPESLPALWRLPRRLFIGAVALDAVILSFVPMVAHAAHAGGFLFGAAFVALVSSKAPEQRPASSWLRAANGLAGLAVLVALAMAGLAAADFEQTWERRALVLLEQSDPTPEELNEAAWTIAIAEEPTGGLLELAEQLAERAVQASQRAYPHILDTLAEVYFVQGRDDEALAVNAEALRISPEDRYLREQRRRYKGERARDDRPDAGGLPDEPELPEAPGVRV